MPCCAALSPVQSSTVVRGSLYTASYMAALPSMKDYLQHHTAVGGVPGAPLVAAGICAGFLGTLATHPIDTIKTRMQVEREWQPTSAAFWAIVHTLQGLKVLHCVSRRVLFSRTWGSSEILAL
jgi:hypothetical protein